MSDILEVLLAVPVLGLAHHEPLWECSLQTSDGIEFIVKLGSNQHCHESSATYQDQGKGLAHRTLIHWCRTHSHLSFPLVRGNKVVLNPIGGTSR